MKIEKSLLTISEETLTSRKGKYRARFPDWEIRKMRKSEKALIEAAVLYQLDSVVGFVHALGITPIDKSLKSPTYLLDEETKAKLRAAKSATGLSKEVLVRACLSRFQAVGDSLAETLVRSRGKDETNPISPLDRAVAIAVEHGWEVVRVEKRKAFSSPGDDVHLRRDDDTATICIYTNEVVVVVESRRSAGRTAVKFNSKAFAKRLHYVLR